MAYEDLLANIAQQGQQMGMLSQAPVHPIARAINNYAQARMFGQAMQSQKAAEEQARRQQEEQIKVMQQQEKYTQAQTKLSEQQAAKMDEMRHTTWRKGLAAIAGLTGTSLDEIGLDDAFLDQEMGASAEYIFPVVAQVAVEKGFQSRAQRAQDEFFINQAIATSPDRASAIRVGNQAGIPETQAVRTWEFQHSSLEEKFKVIKMASESHDFLYKHLYNALGQIDTLTTKVKQETDVDKKAGLQKELDAKWSQLNNIYENVLPPLGDPLYEFTKGVIDMMFSEESLRGYASTVSHLELEMMNPLQRGIQEMQLLGLSEAVSSRRTGDRVRTTPTTPTASLKDFNEAMFSVKRALEFNDQGMLDMAWQEYVRVCVARKLLTPGSKVATPRVADLKGADITKKYPTFSEMGLPESGSGGA